VAGEVSYLEIGADGATRVFSSNCLHLMGNDGEGWFQIPSVKAGLHGATRSHSSSFSLTFPI